MPMAPLEHLRWCSKISVFTRFFRSSARNIFLIIRTVATDFAPGLLAAADTAGVSVKTDH